MICNKLNEEKPIENKIVGESFVFDLWGETYRKALSVIAYSLRCYDYTDENGMLFPYLINYKM